MGITIADVAKAAGVSMMTVSRALNDKEGVSATTRRRIVDLAQEMGYQPSGIARGLATKRTATVGLIVPDIANPFFAEIARGVEDVAYAHDYNVFLLNANENIARELNALVSLQVKQVDGLIWCSSRLPEAELQEQTTRFAHVILINRTLPVPHAHVTTLQIDDVNGAHQVVTYFISRQRGKIAFIAGPSDSQSGAKRRAGFLAACREHGLAENDYRLFSCSPTSAGGYAAAQSALAEMPHVNGIWSYNDLVAVGVLQACRENGRAVPADVALIGADNIPLATLISPQLSTLHVDKYGLGAQAMELLRERIATSQPGPLPPRILTPKLILRESTPPAA
jgi:LacI family transcriptional regulator